eukprot:10297778-Lingulodinium_polyedra.AAC.1
MQYLRDSPLALSGSWAGRAAEAWRALAPPRHPAAAGRGRAPSRPAAPAAAAPPAAGAGALLARLEALELQ